MLMRRSTHGKMIRKSGKSNAEWFKNIYDLAVSEKRNPDDTDVLATGAAKIDVKFNGTTPITLLACQGNHRAVEFLLGCGADPDHAVTGYAAAGYLLDAERAHEVLTAISDQELRNRLALAAEKFVTYDIMAVATTSCRLG